jgi:hypothetical protein
MAAARQVEGYDAIFAATSGNWENYTLDEHTETVLRNFDENYADQLPVNLLAPMRLGIIVHDAGKPAAHKARERRDQKKYNVAQAADFFGKLGIDSGTQTLLLAVIGEGMELAYQIDIRHAGAPAEAAMHDLATRTLQSIHGGEVDQSQIDGFIEMCKILQICDGGAYTSMATTAYPDRGGYYRNGATFNSSFAPPTGLGKRDIRLRRGDEPPAPPDLTPEGTRPPVVDNDADDLV